MSDQLLRRYGWMVGDLEKKDRKKTNHNSVAPEHDEKHRENKSKMKKSEKQLIESVN